MTCNFFKVLVGRVTKLVKFREILEGREEEPDEGRHYHNGISPSERYARYVELVNETPGMTVPYDVNFRKDMKRFESQLSSGKFFANNNKTGERGIFVKQFGLRGWQGLNLYQRRRHSPKDCVGCSNIHDYVDVMSKKLDESQPKVSEGVALVEELFTAVKLSGFD